MASPLSLKELVALAITEGEVDVVWSGGLHDTWRPRFEAAFNHQYGFHLSFRTVPQGGDVVLGGEMQATELAQAGKLASVRWNQLFGAPRETSLFKDGALAFAQSTVRPAYNPRVVPAVGSWDALLDAKWKGRLGVSNAMDGWSDLSILWGDDKVRQYLRALAARQPAKGTPAEIELALEKGAIDGVAALDSGLIQQARDRAAPVAAADVQPVLLQSVIAAPLRSAPHPSAAILFAGFLITDEGQQLWRQYAGQGSFYTVGSPLRLALQTKQYVLADERFLLKEQATRAAEYGNILGF